jgi:asparagine synthase (glutamine-hydrolysing)
MPLDRWFREGLRPTFEEQVLGEPDGGTGWIDRRVVERLWSEHQCGAFDHGHTLWALWAFRAWLETLGRVDPLPSSPRDVVRVG